MGRNQDAGIRRRLTVNVAAADVTVDVLLERPLEEGSTPARPVPDRAVLLFVDPFGLALSYDTLALLRRSRSHGPIDVILHFSTLSIARMGRAAVTGSGAPMNAEHLDRARSGPSTGVLFSPTFRRSTEHPRSRQSSPHNGSTRRSPPIRDVPVAVSAGSQAARPPTALHAHVVLPRSHREGPWTCRHVGNACVDWLMRCEIDDYEAYLAQQEVEPSL